MERLLARPRDEAERVATEDLKQEEREQAERFLRKATKVGAMRC